MFYIYNPLTNEFEGSKEGQPNPKDPGKFLPPPYSTKIEPMEAPINKMQVCDGVQWSLVDDYRGQAYWYKETAEQAEFELGEATDETMTDLEPGANQIWGTDSWIEDISYHEKDKLDELRTAYNEQSVLPVSSGVSTWNGGESSAHRINGKAETMIHQGTDLGEIYDINNTPHELADIAIKDIAGDISVAYEAVFKHYQTKKNEVAFCVNNPDVIDRIACVDGVVW